MNRRLPRLLSPPTTVTTQHKNPELDLFLNEIIPKDVIVSRQNNLSSKKFKTEIEERIDLRLQYKMALKKSNEMAVNANKFKK